MRPRSTCTRVMGREEYGEGKELLMILSIPPHQWSMVVVVSWRGHVWLPVELVLLYYWWCDCWQKQQDEFWSVSGNIICSYSAKCFKLIGRRFTVQMDNDPKHTAKATKEFFEGKRSGLLCNGQVNHLTWIRLSMHFHLLKTKLKENAQEQQELKTVAR